MLGDRDNVISQQRFCDVDRALRWNGDANHTAILSAFFWAALADQRAPNLWPIVVHVPW